MTVITNSAELGTICLSLKNAKYLTVDTEFIRDKFYYPQLCLIQIASEDEVFAVDPINNDINLEPVFELFNNKKIIKVFHSARQDIEIILKLSGKIPEPLFDTQVAAMVCGFGESASYATLVEKLVHERIDKSSRFTDWSRRPLSEKQIKYALSDVTHLRIIYKKLLEMLENSNRTSWLTEEMANLTNPDNYYNDPDEIWKRLRPKSNSRQFLGLLKELAKWREIKAQNSNKPRGHILKDAALLDIAASAPKTANDLSRIRGIGKLNNQITGEIIEIIKNISSIPEAQLPKIQKAKDPLAKENKPLFELMKVLLKAKCEENNVAEKLVASSDDLKLLASNSEKETPLLKGWRYKIFGQYAIALQNGEIALSADKGKIKIIKL